MQEEKKKLKVKKAFKKFFKRKEDSRLLRQPHLYTKYMGRLQHCAGKYHEYEVDPTVLKGCPKLKFHYSISDVGNAEIRVIVSNC
jgi:hypothetical protein